MSEVEDLINIGTKHFNNGDFNSAIANFKIAESLEKDNITVILSLASSYNKLADLDNAIKYYKKLIEKTDKDLYKWHAIIGDLLTQKKKYKEALTHLNKAMNLNPNYILVYYYMGNYRLAISEYTVAIEYYKKAQKMGSKSAKLYFKMGMAYKHMGEYGLCENCMRKVLEKNPLDMKAKKVYQQVSGLYQKMKKFDMFYRI